MSEVLKDIYETILDIYYFLKKLVILSKEGIMSTFRGITILIMFMDENWKGFLTLYLIIFVIWFITVGI